MKPWTGLECVISKKRSISKERGCWLAVANMWSDVEFQWASPCCSVENIDRIHSFQRRETDGGAVRTPGSLRVTEEGCKNKLLRSEENTNSSALNPNVCACLCVKETPWDSSLLLLEKVNTVKASLCKEGKVVCADTQTITGAVWAGCSHIVIPLVHSFHYRWLTSKGAFSQTRNTEETTLNEPCPFKFG